MRRNDEPKDLSYSLLFLLPFLEEKEMEGGEEKLEEDEVRYGISKKCPIDIMVIIRRNYIITDISENNTANKIRHKKIRLSFFN